MKMIPKTIKTQFERILANEVGVDPNGFQLVTMLDRVVTIDYFDGRDVAPLTITVTDIDYTVDGERHTMRVRGGGTYLLHVIMGLMDPDFCQVLSIDGKEV